MSLWVQHLVVLMLVAACVAVVGWQLVRTFRNRPGRLGACCSRGCNSTHQSMTPARTAFMPVELLARGRRR